MESCYKSQIRYIGSMRTSIFQGGECYIAYWYIIGKMITCSPMIHERRKYKSSNVILILSINKPHLKPSSWIFVVPRQESTGGIQNNLTWWRIRAWASRSLGVDFSVWEMTVACIALFVLTDDSCWGVLWQVDEFERWQLQRDELERWQLQLEEIERWQLWSMRAWTYLFFDRECDKMKILPIEIWQEM